eukprot:scaffold17288_cov66-Phaeocystis_antarctica.AAC.4
MCEDVIASSSVRMRLAAAVDSPSCPHRGASLRPGPGAAAPRPTARRSVERSITFVFAGIMSSSWFAAYHPLVQLYSLEFGSI